MVKLTLFKLIVEVCDLLGILSHGRQVRSPMLVWSDFSQLFMVNLLPQSVRDGLTHEFKKLEQTKSMTLSEYMIYFTQLFRYDRYPINEEICVKRFIKRRGDYLLRLMVGSNSSTFNVVLSLTL